MSLPLKIAWRYLVSKKGHQAVNIISIVAVCGVVVATAALICVLSVFNGFRGLIMGKLAMLDPQVAITATMGKTINDADSVIDQVTALPGVERALPVVEDQALAMYAQYQMPVRLKGVPDDYNTINDMDSVIVDGQWKLRDQVSRYAVAGAGPAVRLCVRPEFLGMVRLYAPQRQGRVNQFPDFVFTVRMPPKLVRAVSTSPIPWEPSGRIPCSCRASSSCSKTAMMPTSFMCPSTWRVNCSTMTRRRLRLR